MIGVLLLAGASSCKKTQIDEVYSGCDPLDPALCALPFPSSYFQEPDGTTVTGQRLAFPDGALGINRDDVPVRGQYWNEKDGFSINTQMLAYFADLSGENLVGHANIADYASDSATIVVVDAATGERVPVWAELDSHAPNPEESLLIIHPAQPLDHATRYVVGIRGLKTTAGSAVAVSEAFAALRDGTPTDTWDVEGRRAHFDAEVFPVLEGAGFKRGDLQLAWDFTTMSRESSLGRADFIRDDAHARVGADGPDYTVTKVEDADCSTGESIGRTIYFNMMVPSYTTEDKPGTFLSRDDDGMPMYMGDSEVEVMVRVPCSVIQDPGPSFVLQYGHGLLGDKGEARTGYLSEMANRYRWIVVATDWTGMMEDDVGPITMMMVNDVSDFAMIPERSMQGFLNFDMALTTVLTSFATDANVTFDGISVVDPTRFGYYGNSQGGVMGGGYLGFSQQLTRGVMGVPGAPYSLLLMRSHDFEPFFMVFQAKYTDQREIALLIAAFQTLWDPGETGGWLHDVKDAGKQVLLQDAIGDAQVTTLGAQYMARAYGASTVKDQTRPVWGVEEKEPGFTGSALVEWLYSDGPEEPSSNLPPDVEKDTHECPRREPDAQEQLRDFLETGVVNNYCEGPCTGVREGFCD